MRLLIFLFLLTATSASAATTTEVTSRQILTQHQMLRGTMRFPTPADWKTTSKSGIYTARFRVEDAGCPIDISASIRGKATRRSAVAQVHQAIHDPLVATGTRPHGAYGIGRTGAEWRYGIAVVRVAQRRFGQLRIFAKLSGTDCSAPEGSLVTAMKQVLRRATSQLRVARFD